MAEDRPVGYKNPPREHRFKPGNTAASKNNRRAKKKSNAIELPVILDRVLRTKRKVKRGDQVYSAPVAEIMVERFVQMLTSGTPREVALVMQLVEKYLPDALTKTAETLEITLHRAPGSAIPAPPDDLWEESKA